MSCSGLQPCESNKIPLEPKGMLEMMRHAFDLRELVTKHLLTAFHSGSESFRCTLVTLYVGRRNIIAGRHRRVSWAYRNLVGLSDKRRALGVGKKLQKRRTMRRSEEYNNQFHMQSISHYA